MRNLLGRTVIDTLDPVIPSRHLALLLPIVHPALNSFKIGNALHEVSVRQLLLIKGVGKVVPELQNIPRRHRPEFERLVTGDLPAGIQANHIVIVNFTLDHISAIALFYFGDKLGLFVIQFPIKLLLDQVDDRSVIKFIRRFRKVLPPVQAFQHGRKHDRSCCFIVLGGTTTKPTVSLQPQGRAMHTGLIFDAPLDKEVISKNLGHSPFFLYMLTALSHSFRETIKEIEGCPVRVQR